MKNKNIHKRSVNLKRTAVVTSFTILGMASLVIASIMAPFNHVSLLYVAVAVVAFYSVYKILTSKKLEIPLWVLVLSVGAALSIAAAITVPFVAEFFGQQLTTCFGFSAMAVNRFSAATWIIKTVRLVINVVIAIWLYDQSR